VVSTDTCGLLTIDPDSPVSVFIPSHGD